MFSNDEAEQLIKLPKIINGNGYVNLSDERNRLALSCSDTPEYSFIIEITSNKKIEFKVSIHHQEHNSFIGLLRVDYKGGHQNPLNADGLLPDRFKPYIAKKFEFDEPHIHCYVAGPYRPLAWALPLDVLGFPVLNVDSPKKIAQAIHSFAQEINVRSPLTIQDSIL